MTQYLKQAEDEISGISGGNIFSDDEGSIMCEIFGISTASPYDVGDLLQTFFSHSVEHHSGWGIAVMSEGGAAIEKEPVRAIDSRYLKERLHAIRETNDMLAHIRLATVGYMEYENCHPFAGQDSSGRQWVLVHNGTMFQAPYLSVYTDVQRGTTDSERILWYIRDRINEEIETKGRALSFDERFAVLEQAVFRLSEGCKLNLMIHDGEYLYIHRNYKHSLYYYPDGDAVVFATAPLTPGSRWQLVPDNRLFAYRNGACEAEGARHSHTFEYTEEQLRYLYSAFAAL